MANPLTTLLVVTAWYVSNIGVLLLNKFLLSNTSFKSPVFLTLCHMLACMALSFILGFGGMFPIKPLKSRKQLYKVVLLSTIFCITIVLGNLSLKYIPVSFNQAIGSTTPFFTAIFAVLLQGHWEAPMTYVTLIPIMAGVVVASGGEPLFNAFGFAACMLATSGRALKSVVQSMLMTDPNEKLDPMSLLAYMSTISVLLLLPTTGLLEPTSFGKVYAMVEAQPTFFWWLLSNSCLAYAVNLTNFLVTKFTSALTLQVLGNCKGVIAAVVSVILFRNPVTAKGCTGYAITLMGVFMYSEAKKRFKVQRPAGGDTNAKGSSLPVSDAGESSPLLKTSHAHNAHNVHVVSASGDLGHHPRVAVVAAPDGSKVFRAP